MGIIFAGFGLTLNIIGPGLYSALLVMVLVTTLAAPPLLKRFLGAAQKGPAQDSVTHVQG